MVRQLRIHESLEMSFLILRYIYPYIEFIVIVAFFIVVGGVSEVVSLVLKTDSVKYGNVFFALEVTDLSNFCCKSNCDN